MYYNASTTLDDAKIVIFGLFPQQPSDILLSEKEAIDPESFRRCQYKEPKKIYDTTTNSAISISDEPAWLIKTKLNLKKISALPKNWDGYGSPPLLNVLLNNALSFLEGVKNEDLPTPFVAPISGGAVQFEWHYEDNNLGRNSTNSR